MSTIQENEGLWPKMNMNFDEEAAPQQEQTPPELAIEIWKLPPQKRNSLFDAGRTHSTDYEEEDLRHLKPAQLSDIYIAEREEDLPAQLPPPRRQEVHNISDDSLWEWLQREENVEEGTEVYDDGKDESEKLLATLGKDETSSPKSKPLQYTEQSRYGRTCSRESPMEPIAEHQMLDTSDEAAPHSSAQKGPPGNSLETEAKLTVKQRSFEPKGSDLLPPKHYVCSVFDAIDDNNDKKLTFQQSIRLAKTVLPLHLFERLAPVFEMEDGPDCGDELLLWRHQIEGFLRYIIYYDSYFNDYAVREQISTLLTGSELLQLFGAPAYFAIFGDQSDRGERTALTYVQFCSRLAKNTCTWNLGVPEEVR